jgi:hypothetical protein
MTENDIIASLFMRMSTVRIRAGSPFPCRLLFQTTRVLPDGCFYPCERKQTCSYWHLPGKHLSVKQSTALTHPGPRRKALHSGPICTHGRSSLLFHLPPVPEDCPQYLRPPDLPNRFQRRPRHFQIGPDRTPPIR